MRLLLVFIKVLLPVVQALLIDLLAHLERDEYRVVAAEGRRLVHQVSAHEFRPKAAIRLKSLVIKSCALLLCHVASSPMTIV